MFKVQRSIAQGTVTAVPSERCHLLGCTRSLHACRSESTTGMAALPVYMVNNVFVHILHHYTVLLPGDRLTPPPPPPSPRISLSHTPDIDPTSARHETQP